MSKPISPVKPLLAAIVVASGAHSTTSDSNSMLLSNSALHSAKLENNTLNSALQHDVKAITQSQHRRLDRAWQLVVQQLHQTANSSRWGTIMYRSFGVDLTVAEALRQQWARNNFADLPSVEIADLSKVVMSSKSTNKRAIAAYSASDNRIYLSQQLLDNATAKQLAKVWLEEIGHSIDNRFNQVDTVGDEGAIFAKLITTDSSELPKQGIENLELQILQASNDHALLPIENQYRPVELATIEVGATCSLNNAILSASRDTAMGGCTAGSGADQITFNATTNGTPIQMTGQGSINADLTITGNGMSPTTVIQAAANSRHFAIVNSATATIANLSLTGSSFDGNGGSIRVARDSASTLNQVEITNSTSDMSGGAILVAHSSLIMNNSTLHHNSARTKGGAIYALEASLTINNSYLHSNTATNGDGGAASIENSDLFISGSLIANNTASDAGGIYVSSYDNLNDVNLNMVNSTFYNNTATSSGGNIYLSAYNGYITANIVNSTISHGSAAYGNNIATAVGGYEDETNLQLTVLNTIIANAVSTGDCDIDDSDTTFTLINSLVEDGCEEIDTEISKLIGDPALGALADNGGLLPTMALQSGSPAIDAGTTTSSISFSEVSFGFDLNGDGDATDTGLTVANLAYDARGTGFARVTGGTIDLGAFEFGSESTPTVTVPLRWDIDGNGSSEMADGSLVLRYLFGFRGDVLIDNAIGIGASLTTATEIENAIQALVDNDTLDIDGNSATTTVDGSLLLRYLLGYREQTLINGAVGQGANRSSSIAIQAYIESPD